MTDWQPQALVHIERKEYWVVVVTELDGTRPRQMSFYTREEAEARMQGLIDARLAITASSATDPNSPLFPWRRW